MLKLKSLLSVAAIVTILFSTSAFAFVGTKKKQATFKVRIENIAAAELESADGAKYPFALSPGLFIVNPKKQYFMHAVVLKYKCDPEVDYSYENFWNKTFVWINR